MPAQVAPVACQPGTHAKVCSFRRGTPRSGRIRKEPPCLYDCSSRRSPRCSSPATAQAQTEAPPIPPENAIKLSEIIAAIETRDQFRYISEIDWDEDGFYRVIYFTADKAKVEININPATGQPQ